MPIEREKKKEESKKSEGKCKMVSESSAFGWASSRCLNKGILHFFVHVFSSPTSFRLQFYIMIHKVLTTPICDEIKCHAFFFETLRMVALQTGLHLVTTLLRISSGVCNVQEVSTSRAGCNPASDTSFVNNSPQSLAQIALFFT
jgi:hypothetical protein